jgi:hypothetical protein
MIYKLLLFYSMGREVALMSLTSVILSLFRYNIITL